MTFRGVYRDGVVILEDAVGLRNGTVVEVVRPARTRKRRAVKDTAAPDAASKTTRNGKRQKDPLEAFFGIWKDRADWKGKSTARIARELREKAMGRRTRG